MTLDQFVTQHTNKFIDFDNFAGGQCMDLFRFYVRDVLGYPQPRPVRGAANIWLNYDTDLNLSTFYDKIPNTPNGVPQKGDVMIWNMSAGAGYGHISVVLSGDVNSFVSFDQNFPTNSPCVKVTHTYKNVYGWLRPKGIGMSTVQVDSKTFEELVTKATWADEHKKIPCMPIYEHNDKMTEKQQEIDRLTAKVRELELQIMSHVCTGNPTSAEWVETSKTVTTTEGNTITSINYDRKG